jgi:hypothetical protein
MALPSSSKAHQAAAQVVNDMVTGAAANEQAFNLQARHELVDSDSTYAQAQHLLKPWSLRRREQLQAQRQQTTGEQTTASQPAGPSTRADVLEQMDDAKFEAWKLAIEAEDRRRAQVAWANETDAEQAEREADNESYFNGVSDHEDTAPYGWDADPPEAA